MNLMKRKDDQTERLLKEIQNLSRQVAELQGKKEARLDTVRLLEEYEETKRKLIEKQIEFDREKEKWDREKREVEHMVGLERKRMDQEITLAKKETIITVREEQLKEDRARFEENMKFMRERMEGELDRLNTLTGEILERLPVVKVDRAIRETIGAAGDNGNGHLEE